ncbi:MAG: hypothetical protein ACRD29_17915, partial [Acidimicrobiales bacterium]
SPVRRVAIVVNSPLLTRRPHRMTPARANVRCFLEIMTNNHRTLARAGVSRCGRRVRSGEFPTIATRRTGEMILVNRPPGNRLIQN